MTYVVVSWHLWNCWIHSWCIDSEPCSSLVLSQIPFRSSLKDLFQHIYFLFDTRVWIVNSVWICIQVWHCDWYSRAFARFNPHWALCTQAQFFGQHSFAEFVTTALQHNPVGQGRFRGLLLCAAIETQQSAIAEVPTGRRVCKLLCRQGLLVVHGHWVHHLGAWIDSCVNWSATPNSILNG